MDIPGLLGRLAGLPGAINQGLLGSMPVDPRLGIDPQMLQQARQGAGTDFAMGLVAGGNDPRTLLASRRGATEGFRGRVFDLLKEQETAKMMQLRDEREKQQANLAAVRVPGMDGIWENLSPQSREQILVENATASQQASEPPNSYQEFMLGGGSLIQDPIARAKAYDDWLLRGKKASGTSISVGMPTTKPGSELAVTQVADAVNQGQSASSLITSANTVRALLDSGAITGIGSELRLDAARALSLSGLNKGGKTKIANTEALRSELAWLAINARSQMKGQGQISDYESKMIEQAAGRDPNISEDGIRTVLAVADRAGRANISNARTKVDVLTTADENLRPLKDTFSIKDPQDYEKTIIDDDTGKSFKVKLGIDGKYYWTDPETNERYVVEE